MTGDELKRTRHQLGMSTWRFGLALGYQGNRNSVQVAIRRLERGGRDVPPAVGRLAAMYALYGVPRGWDAE